MIATRLQLGWEEYSNGTEDVRRLYVAHLRLILPPACKVFLPTVEDADEGEAQEVTMGTPAKITALFRKFSGSSMAHAESIQEPDSNSGVGNTIRSEHKVYRLIPR